MIFIYAKKINQRIILILASVRLFPHFKRHDFLAVKLFFPKCCHSRGELDLELNFFRYATVDIGLKLSPRSSLKIRSPAEATGWTTSAASIHDSISRRREKASQK